MATLDSPNPANLTLARVQTTPALHALTLSNNDFMLQQAGYLAARIENESEVKANPVRRAFELCFQRGPSDPEFRAASALVQEQGLFALCRMLINANEFAQVD